MEIPIIPSFFIINIPFHFSIDIFHIFHSMIHEGKISIENQNFWSNGKKIQILVKEIMDALKKMDLITRASINELIIM